MKKLNPTIYNTNYNPTWCPGCGNFGIWTALKNALAELGIEPRNLVIVYDIGCIGNMASTIKCYGFHSLHGRALPVAVGVKLANPKLTVLAIAGDGGAYGEGTNHFIHSARYNSDVLFLVANNRSFSLTTGQASPTSDLGFVTKTTPFGEVKQPINPIALSLSSGASFVARGVAFEPKDLTEIIKQAIQHKGFSHIDILQQCVTLNKVNTIDWYKKRIYKLRNNKTNNLKLAFDKALETEKIPVGVFYKKDKKTYGENLSRNSIESFRDFSSEVCAVEQKIEFDKKSLLKEYK